MTKKCCHGSVALASYSSRMDLFLWRHAEALDAAPGQDDLARTLSAKGERQAYRVARWLNHVLPASTRVLVSPAQRTLQTAAALERKFKVSPALAPGGAVEALLAAVRWPDSREPVLIVGHQPVLGLALARLVGGREGAAEPWRLRKGGVWWLRLRAADDGDGGLIVLDVRSPDTV